jgi:hypothetical protein
MNTGKHLQVDPIHLVLYLCDSLDDWPPFIYLAYTVHLSSSVSSERTVPYHDKKVGDRHYNQKRSLFDLFENTRETSIELEDMLESSLNSLYIKQRNDIDRIVVIPSHGNSTAKTPPGPFLI